MEYDDLQWEIEEDGSRRACVRTNRSSEFAAGKHGRVHRTALFVVMKMKQDRKPLARRANDVGFQDRNMRRLKVCHACPSCWLSRLIVRQYIYSNA